VSRLPGQCGILNISQPYRPPWPVTGILFYVAFHLNGRFIKERNFFKATKLIPSILVHSKQPFNVRLPIYIDDIASVVNVIRVAYLHELLTSQLLEVLLLLLGAFQRLSDRLLALPLSAELTFHVAGIAFIWDMQIAKRVCRFQIPTCSHLT
jgi:hypothetical protein